MFYARGFGRDRGYVEGTRIEETGEGGAIKVAQINESRVPEQLVNLNPARLSPSEFAESAGCS